MDEADHNLLSSVPPNKTRKDIILTVLTETLVQYATGGSEYVDTSNTEESVLDAIFNLNLIAAAIDNALVLSNGY